MGLMTLEIRYHIFASAELHYPTLFMVKKWSNNAKNGWSGEITTAPSSSSEVALRIHEIVRSTVQTRPDLVHQAHVFHAEPFRPSSRGNHHAILRSCPAVLKTKWLKNVVFVARLGTSDSIRSSLSRMSSVPPAPSFR
jgi:hypothetical protein